MLLIILHSHPLIVQITQIAEALGRRNPNVTNESFEFGKNRTEYRRMLEDVRKNKKINMVYNISFQTCETTFNREPQKLEYERFFVPRW